MARRKRFGMRRSKRGSFRGGFRRARKAAAGISPFIAAGVYGAGRAYMATAINPLTSKIPLGGVSDEVGMIAALWGIKKVIRNPMVSRVATVGQYIEMASLGQAIATGQVSLQNLGAGSTNSGFTATIG